MSMYLRLLHGRRHPREELQEWGADGPTFGPVDSVHTTYAIHIRFGTEENEDCELVIAHEGMVYYSGIWYGDWTVFNSDELAIAGLMRFDEALAVPPVHIDDWIEEAVEEAAEKVEAQHFL